jgi:hypothetical protein
MDGWLFEWFGVWIIGQMTHAFLCTTLVCIQTIGIAIGRYPVTVILPNV